MGWEQYKSHGTNKSENMLEDLYWKQKKKDRVIMIYLLKNSKQNIWETFQIVSS